MNTKWKNFIICCIISFVLYICPCFAKDNKENGRYAVGIVCDTGNPVTVYITKDLEDTAYITDGGIYMIGIDITTGKAVCVFFPTPKK